MGPPKNSDWRYQQVAQMLGMLGALAGTSGSLSRVVDDQPSI